MAYSTNDKIRREQLRQAEIAERDEYDRQQRLDYGRALINSLFSGGTAGIKAGEEFDPNQRYYAEDGSVWDPKLKTQTTRTTTEGRWVRNQPNAGYNRNGSAIGGMRFVPGGEVTRRSTQSLADAFADARGELYAEKPVTSDGIGDDFYDDYRQSIVDFYAPDLERQFDRAREQDVYDFARRGTLRSTMANRRAADRLYEKNNAFAGIQNQAEQQVQSLRGDVSRAKDRSLALLYDTESPTAAANEALSEVNAIQTRLPQLSPLGDIFGAAAVGAQSYRNVRDAQMFQNAISGSAPTQRSAGRLYNR